MPIEQVYCAHCTYGTSALEQREGELADRVLGYSARAGSEDRNELRNDYRAIERFLYYYLPSDTPPEEKQRLDAAGAPRRLFFCPSMGRLQMVGQVAYQQYDTAQRLGSYFAHVLFSDRSSGAWSPLDCLRLWNAPWVQEDSRDHPFKLPSLERLDALWAGATPAIGDDVLLRFLQSSVEVGRASSPSKSAGDGLGRPPHDDDGQVIAPRWLTASAQQRIDLVANTLQGLLALGTQRRESVLLVVEPSVAALVFYGVARLLPKSFAEGLSFSTYEPNAERLPVTLAATTFFDPFSTDIRSDLYRRRGLVMNTFLDRVSEGGPPVGEYARFMIERLLEEGWPAVDHLLESFEATGAKRPEDLELLVPAHRAVSLVLSATPPEGDSWRKSEIAARYLSREVQHQLATAPSGWPQLKTVIGTPNHLAVLELVALDGMPAELQRPTLFLLEKFPGEKLPELIASPHIARWAKLKALVAQVTATGRLPDGCQLLSADGSRLRAASIDRLLPDLLALLPEPLLRAAYAAVQETDRAAFFEALLSAARKPSPSPAALKGLLLEILTQLSDGQLLDALVRYRAELTACFPPPQPLLGTRLGRLLYQLPDQPKHFEQRLSVLNQWKDYFQHPHLAERRLAEWGKVRNALLALRDDAQPAAAGGLDRLAKRLRAPLKTDFKPLAEALNRAMPRRSSQLDELAEVAEKGALSVPQFRARLELAAYNAGAPFSYPKEEADIEAGPGDALVFNGDADQALRRGEQQARLWQLFRELEERLLVYSDDSMGNRKLAALQQIGGVLVGRPNFLADGRRMIEAYFVNNGVWPTGALLAGKRTKHGAKPRKKTSRTPMYAAVSLTIAAAFVALGYYVLERTPTANTSVAGPAKAVAPHEEPKPAVPPTTPPKPSVTEERPKGPSESTKSTAAAPKQAVASTRSKTTPSSPAAVPEPAKTDHESPPREPKPDVPSTAEPTRSVASSNSKPIAPMPAPAPEQGGSENKAPGDVPSSEGGAEAQPTLPTLVDKAASLPGIGASKRVLLKEWSAVPMAITFELHGLASANKNLAGKGRLVEEPSSDGMTVGFVPGAADSGGPPTSIAKFAAEGDGLSFRWVRLDGDQRGLREARDEIRRCVLEIGGEKPSWLALSAPRIAPDPLPLINGRLINSIHSQSKKDDLHVPDDLLLGRGNLQFQDGRYAAFDGPSGPSPYVLQLLPVECQDSGAVLQLVRAKEGGWQVVIRVDDNASDLSNDVKRRKVFNEDLQRLIQLDGNGGIRDQRPEQRDIADLLNRLAKTIGVDEDRIPVLPDTTAREERDQYKRAILDVILSPAKRLDRQLKAIDWLRQHAEKLSAVVYRQVEPQLYAREVVFGDPHRVMVPSALQSDFFGRDDD
ncbi:MAG TPA: hypothetical protein VNH11_01570 [Pirellulales bacterium]|nr:hypothetical protein [Pirellulales bacterium]